MAAETLTLDIIIQGFKLFSQHMASMDRSIDTTGKKWGGLSKLAGGAGKVLGGIAKVGLAAVASGGAAAAGAVTGLAAAIGKMTLEAVPVEGLARAFEGLTADMEGGSNAMLAALQKASGGMIANRDLMESFNKAAALVSKDFAKQLPDAMKYLGKVSAATGTDLDYLLDSLVTGVGRLSPMILDNLAIQVNATEANEAYAKSVGKSASELTKAEQQTAMMNMVLEKLAVNTADLPDVTDTAAGKMANLSTTFQNLKDDIGQAFLPVLTEVVGMFGEMAAEYAPMLAEGLKTVAAFLVENLPPALEIVRVAVENLVSWWTANWPTIAQKVKETWTKVKPVIDKIVAWFEGDGSEAVAAYMENFTAAWDVIKSVADIAVKWFEENLPRIIETGETLLRFWTEHVVPTLDNVWEILKTIVDTGMRVILETITLVMDVICGDWEGAWESVKTIAVTIWDGIVKIAKEFIEGVANAIGTTTKEIVETWRGNWEMLKSIVAGLAGKIVDTVRGFASSLFSAGAALFEGLRAGIESKVNEIIESVVGWIGAIIAAGRAVLGIESPSAVFAGMGRDMMRGLSEGIASLTPQIQAQLAAVVVPGGIGVGGGGGGGTVNNTYAPQYHLTTNSITRPGGLALEFQAMEAMATR